MRAHARLMQGRGTTIVRSRIYHAYCKCTLARTDFNYNCFRSLLRSYITSTSVRTDVTVRGALPGWYHSPGGKPLVSRARPDFEGLAHETSKPPQRDIFPRFRDAGDASIDIYLTVR